MISGIDQNFIIVFKLQIHVANGENNQSQIIVGKKLNVCHKDLKN